MTLLTILSESKEAKYFALMLHNTHTYMLEIEYDGKKIYNHTIKRERTTRHSNYSIHAQEFALHIIRFKFLAIGMLCTVYKCVMLKMFVCIKRQNIRRRMSMNVQCSCLEFMLVSKFSCLRLIFVHFAVTSGLRIVF